MKTTEKSNFGEKILTGWLEITAWNHNILKIRKFLKAIIWLGPKSHMDVFVYFESTFGGLQLTLKKFMWYLGPRPETTPEHGFSLNFGNFYGAFEGSALSFITKIYHFKKELCLYFQNIKTDPCDLVSLFQNFA